MVVTIPRLQASLASSRGVQWLMGRPDVSGGSQAKAMIWHHCSALKVAGAPGRGASWRRSCTAHPGRLSQCRRHSRTVLRLVPRRRATSGALRPSAKSRRICARQLKCCGVLWARIRVSSAWYSASESGTVGGLGPGIIGSCGFRTGVLKVQGHFTRARLVAKGGLFSARLY